MMECESKRSVLVEQVMSKASAPPFLLKTYMVVEDPATDAVISWNDDGSAFVVWQPAEFARDLLPTLFKHANFSSFVRQLNTYGFRKVATNRWEFSNHMFRKGKRDELCKICRRKSTSNKPKANVQVQAASKDHSENEEDQRSSSSSEFTNQLIDENKRLKLDNGVLIYELSLIKKKCNQLVDLVSVYGGCSEKDEDFNDDEGCSLKLFGVTLEVENKRKRPGRELMLA